MVALAASLAVVSLAAPVLAAGGPPDPSADGPLDPMVDNVVRGHGGDPEADESSGANKDPDGAEHGPGAAEDPSDGVVETRSEGAPDEGEPDAPEAPGGGSDDEGLQEPLRTIPEYLRNVALPLQDLVGHVPHRCPGDPRVADNDCVAPMPRHLPTAEAEAVRVEQQPATDHIVEVGAAVGLVAVLLAVLYRLGMLSAGFRGLPLGFRMSRAALHGHPVRKAVLDRLEERPGATTQDLADAAGVTYGRVSYHLSILKREEVVRVRRVDGIKRWFGTGTPRIDDAALAQERLGDPRRATGRLLGYLRVMPGASGSQVARAMGLSPGNVHYHVSRLDDEGLVRRVAHGRRIRHYLTDAGHTLVARLQESHTSPAGMHDGAVPA